MPVGPLTALTASEAARRIRDGDLSAVDYVSALLERAEERSDLNVFISFRPEAVLEAAMAADTQRHSGAKLGPLHGIPVAVKDSVNTASLPTSNGTASLRGFQPQSDADLVRRVVDAGAIVFGKTNLTELSFGWTNNNGTFGPTRNPHDPQRVPGGSSGGSAAAVAAGIVPLAIGADTLGSIRIPASFCGVNGFRPTLDRYPNSGAFALTKDRLDQLGPFARSARDIALFDAAVTAEEAAASNSITGARIGIDEFYMGELDSRVQLVIEETLKRIGDAGAEIVRTTMPEPVHRAFDVSAVIMLHESQPSLARFLSEQGTNMTVDEVVRAMADGKREFFIEHAIGEGRPPEDAYRAMVELQGELKSAFSAHLRENNLAAIAFPAVAAQPPPVGEEHEADVNGARVSFFAAFGRNTALAAAASCPGLVVPAGVDADGLPVGFELDSLPGTDRDLLSLGIAVEDALGYAGHLA
jgi:Asp-tRNA(Asn)/Glu-tRNA(Gln) amidotransferase A subunit family amidase